MAANSCRSLPQTEMGKETTFYQFPRLPLELRTKVWSLLLPIPTIVDLIAISRENDQNAMWLPSSVLDQSPPRSLTPRAKHVSTFVDCLQSPRNPPPALLHVTRETRELILSKWKMLDEIDSVDRVQQNMDRGFRYEGENGIGRRRFKDVQQDGTQTSVHLSLPLILNPVLFNPRIDAMFLADPPGSHRISSLLVLVRWLDTSVVESVRRLGIAYSTWKKDRTFQQLHLLTKFKGLEQVWVCFVGALGGEELRGEGWLQAVQREHFYLEEVREQVRCDVEDLQRRILGWRCPQVMVVDDRRAVLKELTEMVG